MAKANRTRPPKERDSKNAKPTQCSGFCNESKLCDACADWGDLNSQDGQIQNDEGFSAKRSHPNK